MTVEDRVQDLLDRISVEAVAQENFVRISVEGPAKKCSLGIGSIAPVTQNGHHVPNKE